MHEFDKTGLEPCPFCGGADIRFGTNKDDFENAHFEVGCSDCGAAMGWHVDSQPWGDDLEVKKAETIEAWNRRASTTSAGVTEEQTARVTDTRDQFEDWAENDHRDLNPLEFEERTPDNNHYYETDSTNDAYIGWCAALEASRVDAKGAKA